MFIGLENMYYLETPNGNVQFKDAVGLVNAVVREIRRQDMNAAAVYHKEHGEQPLNRREFRYVAVSLQYLAKIVSQPEFSNSDLESSLIHLIMEIGKPYGITPVLSL